MLLLVQDLASEYGNQNTIGTEAGNDEIETGGGVVEAVEGDGHAGLATVFSEQLSKNLSVMPNPRPDLDRAEDRNRCRLQQRGVVTIARNQILDIRLIHANEGILRQLQ